MSFPLFVKYLSARFNDPNKSWTWHLNMCLIFSFSGYKVKHTLFIIWVFCCYINIRIFRFRYYNYRVKVANSNIYRFHKFGFWDFINDQQVIDLSWFYYRLNKNDDSPLSIKIAEECIGHVSPKNQYRSAYASSKIGSKYKTMIILP